MKIRARRVRHHLIWLILVPLFYLPLLYVFGRVAWEPPGRAALWDFLQSAAFRHTLAFTLWESLLSALWSVALSLPGAYFIGRYDFRGRTLARSLLVLPFVLPSILAVLAIVVTYGQNGLLNQVLRHFLGPRAPVLSGLYGVRGIVLTHVFFNFALGIRLIGEALERLDPALLEAASSLGAGPARAWWSVAVPLVLPSVTAAFLLSFIYSSLSFTVVLVFGGIRYRTFEVLIYDRLNQELDFLGAYAVAVVQLALGGFLLILRTMAIRGQQRVSSAFGRPFARALPRGWPRLIFGGYALFLVLFFCGPLLGLLARAWHARGAADGALTAANFAALLSPGFRTGAGMDLPGVLVTSIALAAAAGLGVAALSYFCATLRGRSAGGTVDAAVELPLGASLVTLCFGLLGVYGRLLPAAALVLMAQVLIGLPLGYMVVRAAFTALGAGPLEAARSLGAGWWRAKVEVEIPLLRRALVTAFAYGAAFSLGDVAAVLIIGQGRIVTMAVAVYRLTGHYRFPQALALGSVLLPISLGLFALADRAGTGETGGARHASRAGRDKAYLS